MANINKILNAKNGACFHGEIWIVCPYCNNSIEAQSTKEKYIENGYRVYQCKTCNNYFKDK